MEERYSRLFESASDLYIKDSPIIIKAGVLLRDRITGSVIAQLKLQNVAKKEINYVKVNLTPYDQLKTQLPPKEYEYQFFHVDKYENFGSDIPLVLENKAARSFNVCVTAVAFADGTMWTSEPREWTPDPEFSKSVDNELIYTEAVALSAEAKKKKSKNAYYSAAELFEKVPGYKDADSLAEKCNENARKISKRVIIINTIITIVTAALISLIVFCFIIPGIKYDKACDLYNSGEYEAAITAFEDLGEYKDSEEMISNCHMAIINQKYFDAIRLVENEEFDEAINTFKEIEDYSDSAEHIKNATLMRDYNAAKELYIAGEYEEAIAAFEVLDGYNDSESFIYNCKNEITEKKNQAAYEAAMQLYENEEYEEAINIFNGLGNYKDSNAMTVKCKEEIEKAKEQQRLSDAYNMAQSLYNDGRYYKAALAFAELGDYQDSKDKIYESWDRIAKRDTVSAGADHTVGLKSDGTVAAVGLKVYGRIDVSGWRDIVAISAGADHTVGLKSDRTVVAVGRNDFGQVFVSKWRDIVAISAGYGYTVGLKSDGTVVAVGRNDFEQVFVSKWRDIVAISAGYGHTVGLKSDGTVVAVGLNDHGQCNVSGWRDIVAISAGYGHTVGLKSNGTVVAVGRNDFGQFIVSGWRDIVAISAGYGYTVGLKSDGTVVAVGLSNDGRCDVSEWRGIVAISAGYGHTVGLKSDGTVVAVGLNDHGQCNVSGWTNIKKPDNNRAW